MWGDMVYGDAWTWRPGSGAGSETAGGLRPPAGHRSSRPGLTLLEAILAISLTVLLLAGVLGFYMIVLNARDQGSRHIRDAKLDRALLERIAEEIRHATSLVPGDGIGFRGERHKITIVRVHMPERYAYDVFNPDRDRLPPGQLDIRRISYELLWDEELEDDEGVKLCHGLWRTEQRTFDPNPRFIMAAARPGEQPDPALGAPPVEGELVAPEIKYIEFRYFDGAEWRDRWQVSDENNEADEGLGEQAGGGPQQPPAGGASDLEGLLAQLNQGGRTGRPGEVVPRGPNDNGYALPQAVRITIGRQRVAPEDDDFDFDQLKRMEERREQKYHEDRFTVVVPILQSDRTLLSSRKYGVADSISRQEGGRR